MIDWPVFIGCWVVVAVFFVLNRSSRVNAPDRVLLDQGESVVVRNVPISRIFGFAGKPIVKGDISKIQLTEMNLSLFTHSGNAFDIWVPVKVLGGLAKRAQELFPDAEFKDLQTH